MEKLFYKNLKEFLRELIQVFPEDDSIKVISTSINLSIIDDEEYSLIKMFYEALAPLEKLIINRDNQFFYTDPNNYWKNVTYSFLLVK